MQHGTYLSDEWPDELERGDARSATLEPVDWTALASDLTDAHELAELEELHRWRTAHD